MFEEISRRVKAAAVERLNEAAGQVAATARARAPGSLGAHVVVEEAAPDGEHSWTARVVSLDPHGRASDPKAIDPGRYNVPAFHEFGTRSMAARPYMRPALDEAAPAIVEDMQQAVTEAARGARPRGARQVVKLKMKVPGGS